MIVRYLVLLLLAFPNLALFYFIFTPLTIYPVFWILNIFFNITLSSPFIIFDGFSVEIIGACVAGSAYYLLTVLNLSTPMRTKVRVKALLFSFAALLILNIIRIVALVLVFIYGVNYFDITHKFFWYALSSIFVVIIWFAEVKLFKIKDMPIYTDLKYLYKKSKFRKSKNCGK